MTRFVAGAVAALLLVFGLARAEDAPIPALSGRVVDVAGTLTPEQKRDLETKLAEFEQRKGSQIVILIVGTTFPEAIEAYSIRVAETWKIGRKDVDDGVLVVLATSDRAIRLEVGYGLEGAVPDAVAKRLVEEAFIPRFREGDFYGGLNDGVGRLIRVIDGEALPEPTRAARSDAGPQSLETYFVLFFAIVFAGGGILRAMLGRFPAAALVGAGTGVLAWFIAAPIFVAALVGIVGFVLTLLGGAMGGFPRGGRGGGWGGGGFGGGGGLSGGGGGFGGGGASGRW